MRAMDFVSATGWSEPPRHPRARQGTIDVWRGELGQSGSRAMLLDVLSRYTGSGPDELRLGRSPGGKPHLTVPHWGDPHGGGPRGGGPQGEGAHASDLRFNMSHSEKLTLVAVSAGTEVGIDVETIGRDRAGRIDEVAIARRILGLEQARRLQEMEGAERRIEFLRAWTAHEARVKCLGIGLGGAAAQGREGENESAQLWTRELDVGEGAIAALAAQGGAGCEVRCWEWSPRARTPAEPDRPSAGSASPARGHGSGPSR